MNDNYIHEEKAYIVFGFRREKVNNVPSIITEILGTFTTIEQALICQDLHRDLDTTLEGVTIESTDILEEVPPLSLMLRVTIENNDEITVRTQAVSLEEKPWLKDDDIFEALAYKEDEQDLIAYAQEWYENKYHKKPKIVVQKPPSFNDI